MGKLKDWYKKIEKDSAKIRELMANKCPRCGSPDLNKVKANAMRDLGRTGIIILFPLAAFFGKSKKPLNVCTKCSFSWEDR